MGGVQDGSESVGSDVGGTIPPLQGADLPANADAGMYMSEEFRRTVHAWRGTELPVQSAVSRAEVEELARDAESALQATAEQSAWDVARLTHETGTTFGKVEAAMMDMDSRVESLDDRLLRLQEEQNSTAAAHSDHSPIHCCIGATAAFDRTENEAAGRSASAHSTGTAEVHP